MRKNNDQNDNILISIEKNHINKAELNKLFSNLNQQIEDKTERINTQMIKANEDLTSIKSNQNDIELQTKGGIDYIKGISNIYSIPEKIDNQIDIFNKVYSQLNEYLNDNQTLKQKIEQMHTESNNNSFELNKTLILHNENHQTQYRDIVLKFRNINELMLKSIEFNKLVNEKMTDELNKHNTTQSSNMDEIRE